MKKTMPPYWEELLFCLAENEEDICESTDGDVQKKIIPWRLMTPDSHVEQEYTCRKKGYKPGGLILVTSLINKVPNLGGKEYLD